MRLANGLSQEALGARMGGVSKQQIGRLESGKIELNQRWMRRIASALGCTTADLLPDDDNPYRLAPDEKEIIDALRRIDCPKERDRTLSVIRALLAPFAGHPHRDAA